MLSDKIINKLDSALDEYFLNGIDETDKNVVIDKIENKDNEILKKIAHFAVIDRDKILDEYRKCKTLKEFKEVQERDINRKFLFDTYTLLVGNLSVEEVEERYCNDKKKGL